MSRREEMTRSWVAALAAAVPFNALEAVLVALIARAGREIVHRNDESAGR
jgi:hypothetical protein